MSTVGNNYAPTTVRALDARIAFPTRSGPRQTIRDSLTMAWRGLLKIKHTPEQLSDVTLQPIVFTLMFTYLLGGAIAGDVGSYLPFIIPGILVQTVVNTAIATGVQLREDMSSGVFDRFRSLPVARIAPLAGALLADTLRYAFAAVLTFVVGIAMGYRPAGGLAGVAACIVLVMVCAWALSWIFAFFGVVARSAASVQNSSMIVLFLLTFVSNAFVPVASMPTWLQAFVNVNPITYLVSACRSFANEAAWSPDAGWALLGAAVVVAIFAPLTVRCYLRRA